MSQIAPYKVPLFAWPLTGQAAPYTITFESFGAAGTFGSPYVYTWTGWETGLPVFPFLAQDLETQLNLNTDDTNTWKVRWVFETGGNLSNLQATGLYAASPKLVISIDNAESYTSGTITITPSSPVGTLDIDYIQTLGNNWLGMLGTQTINFAFDYGDPDAHIQVPYGPAGVWNPAVLSYGDERVRSSTLGMSVNSGSLRKSVTNWGTRYRRLVSLPLVHASNLYAYRRVNPLFEENATQRLNPNSLYEAMIRDLQEDLPLHVFTEVPLSPNEPNSTTYFAAFRGRICKLNDSALLSDDGEGWSFQAEDQRLVNVSLSLFEDPTELPSGY